MPVYTHTHTAEDKHTDRQTSADNTAPVPDTFLLHSQAPDLHWTFPVLPETMLAHTQIQKAKDKHTDS